MITGCKDRPPGTTFHVINEGTGRQRDTLLLVNFQRKDTNIYSFYQFEEINFKSSLEIYIFFLDLFGRQILECFVPDIFQNFLINFTELFFVGHMLKYMISADISYG